MMSDSTGLEMVRMSRGNALSVAAAFIVCILVPASALLGVASWEALAASADDTVIDSLAFFDEEITVVLSALVQMSDDLSLVADSSVRGTVTQTLRNTRLLDAMELIVRANGFDFRRKGNAIVVATPERLASVFDTVEVAVIPLKHRSPVEIIATLDLIVPKESIRADARTSSVIVSGTAAQVNEAKRLVAHLDTPVRQVWIQSRIEEVATSALSNLGIKWDSLSLKPQNNPIGQVIGASIDVIPKLGFLQDEGYARTVASTQLTVADGSTARILLGDRIPVKRATVGPDGTRTESWEYFEAGVRLEVTPEMGMEDEVSLKVKPEISSVEGTAESGGDSLPWLKTREAETVIRVRDGETAVIGGLLQTQELEELTKVPLLGDIPIMGELFKRTDKDIRQTELLIFLTVEVIDDEYRKRTADGVDIVELLTAEEPSSTSVAGGQ